MKRLTELLAGVSHKLSGPADVMINDIVFDSRAAKTGALFFAFRGVKQDGRTFIPAAIKAGARAIVVDSEVEAQGVPIVRVTDMARALALMSSRFWNFPSQRLLMVGITGTNGKTTTSFLVEHILQTAGVPTGVMGTINYRFKGTAVNASNTTPFASEIQRFLSQVVEGGGKACAMEVSSHALSLGRVEGVDFDIAVFTNLTQDHLDFHQTMENYREAKALLFSSLSPATQKTCTRKAIINGDDPAAEVMAAASQVPVWRYRAEGPAELVAENIQSDAQGSRFTLRAPGDISISIQLPLLGNYNIMNALAAVGVALSQEIAPEIVQRALATAPGIPGRMERLNEGQKFTVVVDYAHTDDALRQVMTALRRLKPHRLITVFGCGGDRDRTKRPLMGQAAAEMSDEVIVTSDNPRSEDVGKIALDIEVGVRRVRNDRYKIIIEREEAIHEALRTAKPNDIVLIAGKGHENYQILEDRTIPFDDREVARRFLRAL